ncbi:hypothetical protein [Spirillospora sp. NPDC047279]|uniref:hypothetical protein n=1 Tax=Spirillospora sp. NPDC047279 TaxID=3155478 RepID=UPI00340C4F06
MLGVHVDLPWAYAVGAGIALAAAHQLRGEVVGDAVVGRAARGVGAKAGRHFVLAMAFGVFVFVPMSLWVAYRFPEWATMQRADEVDLVRVGAAELGLIAAGFVVTRWLVVGGRMRWAAVQPITASLAMAVLMIHGWDGDGWRRMLSTGRTDYETFPQGVEAVAAQVVGFVGSELGVTLMVSGAVTVGALGVVMGVLHQFGLTDAGADGPGLIRAGIIGGITVGGVMAVGGVISLLTWGVGWVGAIGMVPLLWLAVAAKGSYASLVVNDLGLPGEREE